MSITPDEFRYALETGIKNEHYEHLQKQFNKIKTDENLLFFYAGTFYSDGAIDAEGNIRLNPINGEKIVMTIYVEGNDPRFPLGQAIGEGTFWYPSKPGGPKNKQVAFNTFNSGTTLVSDIYGFNVTGGEQRGIAAYAPIFDENQEPIGLIGVLMLVEDVLAKSNSFAINMTLSRQG